MYKRVELSEIVAESKYLRLDTNTDDLEKSISNIGLLHPLIVNDELRLIAGGRRYSALKKLGIDKVEVKIVKSNEALEQELMAIDENMMRKPLNSAMFDAALKRAKDIYEELNPTCVKNDEEPSEEKDKETTPSFAEVTAEKYGMTEAAVRKSIQRDEKSSAKIKQAREKGVLNNSQANHLIKLEKGDQNEILDYVAELPSSKIRDVVKVAEKEGIEKAIEEANNMDLMPPEFEAVLKRSKNLAKVIEKAMAEEIFYEGEEVEDLIKHVKNLKKQLNAFLQGLAEPQE